MQCNIDAKGKAVRLINGLLSIAAGVVVMAVWQWWILGGLLVAAGAFSVFEARAGWCVVRAMGFKTPL